MHIGQPFSHICVIDFEATCWREKKVHRTQEISEVELQQHEHLYLFAGHVVVVAPPLARALQLNFLLCCSALLLVQWRESFITSSSLKRTLHWVPSARSWPAFHKFVYLCVFVCECCAYVYMCVSCVCICACVYTCMLVVLLALVTRCVYMSICETACLQHVWSFPGSSRQWYPLASLSSAV